MRILVADDDPAVRELLHVHLTAEGHEVQATEDGDAVLRALAASVPDALVLDVMMPGLDGWSVLDRVRRDDATRSLPVVLLSARDVADDVRRGYEAGASAVLSKSQVHQLSGVLTALAATPTVA